MLYNEEAKEIMADTTEPSGVSSFGEDSEAIELTDTNDPPPANPPVALKAKTMPSTLPGTKAESIKQKAEMIEADPRTPAQPGTSKAAALKTMMAKKSKLQKFSAAAQAEEITRQKEIELVRVKVEAAVMIKVEAGKAALSEKVEFHKHNADEHSEKQKLKHKLQLFKPDKSTNFKWHGSITALMKYSHHQHSSSQLGQVQQLPHHLHQHRVLSTLVLA